MPMHVFCVCICDADEPIFVARHEPPVLPAMHDPTDVDSTLGCSQMHGVREEIAHVKRHPFLTHGRPLAGRTAGSFPSPSTRGPSSDRAGAVPRCCDWHE